MERLVILRASAAILGVTIDADRITSPMARPLPCTSQTVRITP